MTMVMTTALPIGDDLDALRDVIGSARVVGIGETAHHVREYQQLRNRLVRFLVEHMGFGVVAVESAASKTTRRRGTSCAWPGCSTEVPVAFAFDLVAAVPTITPLPPDER